MSSEPDLNTSSRPTASLGRCLSVALCVGGPMSCLVEHDIGRTTYMATVANQTVDAVQSVSAAAPHWMKLPGHWPEQGDLLQWCQTMGPGTAAILVLAGIVYLVFGVQIFRGLVTLNAACVGIWLGGFLGQKAGSQHAGSMMIVGGITFAALAWPLMKWAVALMGGIYGALLGASIWRSLGLPAELCWSGAMIGTVSLGLLSFILFRGSIMMYTSLQGAVMLVFGLLGLLFKYPDLAPKVANQVTSRPFLLPLCIFVPALLGLIYQQTAWTGAPAASAPKK
jgi:hypothetical protein